MTISQIRATCADCHRIFDVEVVMDAPLAVTIASMESVLCPRCHSGNCRLGAPLVRLR